jgi:hypothetical protein
MEVMIWLGFFEDGAKLKIPAEIFPPLLEQLNEYETDPYLLQLSQNMTTDCLSGKFR